MRACLFLLPLILVRLPKVAAAAESLDAFNVIWDSPSANHHGSMPLGNGDVAMNAWMTQDGDLHLLISKTDAWDDNACLLKVGKVRIHFEPNPIVPGRPFRQELKLKDGCLEIAAGGLDGPSLAALEHRWDRGHSGWRQDDIFMAYLGLAEDARKAVVSRARSHDPGERFPAFWGPNYDWTPDRDHGGVLMKAFQAMLLHTDGKKVLLLPAWPKDWNVEFKLHAPQQTIVDGVYRNGKMRSLRVTPESRRADVEMPR